MLSGSSSSNDDNEEVVIVTAIPVVDLAPRGENEAGNDAIIIARELVAAFRQIGFATLVNHGVAAETVQKGFAASKHFFALPLDTKMQYKYQSPTSNRGYIAMGSEKFESVTMPDRKETYDIGREGEVGFQTPWPMELQPAGFKDDLLRYFADFNALNLRLMKLLAIGLGLDDDNFFVDRCNEQHCNLRLLHYPELQRETITTMDETTTTDTTIVRGAIHTDYGSITLLSQDDIGGLRAQRLDGTWISVQPVEGSIIVNVGDMLE
jgi:isopenicillin N synthase-like dioxygenase